MSFFSKYFSIGTKFMHKINLFTLNQGLACHWQRTDVTYERSSTTSTLEFKCYIDNFLVTADYCLALFNPIYSVQRIAL